ncbi:MAG: four helix bundle protein [Rhizonema sp. PD38]|nr:four helix bundle protein [Rhizonema sp. PD38]
MDNSEIQSYRDLRVWQKGMDLAEACYAVTKTFPKEEMYGITSQIRRAVVSIPANIAGGYGQEYIQFLRIAQGSLKELETHLLLAVRVKIATDQAVNPIVNECKTLGRMLRFLIRSLDTKRR